MLTCLCASVLKNWQHSVAALSFMFKFYIIHHLMEQTDTTFLQTFRLEKTRLKSEMPSEVTDWSSPLFVHPRWTETAAALNRYRSTTERPWVGACIIIRAAPQWCCSHWKCLTSRIIILMIKVLLRRDSEIPHLGETFFLHFSGWVWCSSNFGLNLSQYSYVILEDVSVFTILVHLSICFLPLPSNLSMLCHINSHTDDW